MSKHLFCLLASSALVTSQVSPLFAATPTGTVSPTQDNARYVGVVDCKTSGCHGGAGPMRGQYMTWAHDDFHSRSYATLVTARSVQIAAGLGISAATESNRCTVCHAPLADIPPSHLASTATVTEGVSCEACHSGAAAWLRGHTRPDWSYADRVHAGMKDMRDAFVRANTCVACHQVIDPELVKAGHPELIFEMDGQAASEPRHWTEKADWFGPKAWAVGQAVALREISRQLSTQPDNQDLLGQQHALVWLLQLEPIIGLFDSHAPQPSEIAAWSNATAQAFSNLDWKPATTSDALNALAGTSASFTNANVPLAERELRAERLVLGLDRLYKASHPDATAPGQAELSALFDAVQDRARFDASAFSQQLQKFADAIGAKK